MASRPGTPRWLDAVQRLERAIGEPVEALVRRDAYFDLMTRTNRARARLTRRVDGAVEQWLHLFNLPAASDIRRLKEQLARMERQLNRIAKDVADLEEERDGRRPPTGVKAKAKAKPKPRRASAKGAGSRAAADKQGSKPVAD